MKTLLFALVLVTLAALASAKPEATCIEAAEMFVRDYNENAGDKHLKELDQVTGCWYVGSDMHVSLIMKTGNGYYKSCLNVIFSTVDRVANEIKSKGTCQ